MDSIKNREILIDTNVLGYCGDKGYGDGTKKILRLLKDNENKLATSEISCFELIRKPTDNKYREYYYKLINFIDRIPVTGEYLQNGALLSRKYYGNDEQRNRSKLIIEPIDWIIAGTVVHEKGSLLLTANRQHFPMPFWKLVSQCHIMRKTGEGDEIINLFLLEFDYSQM